LAGRLDAVEPRHVDVHDDDVRGRRARRGQRVGAGRRLTDHGGEPAAFDDRLQRLPPQRVVVDDEHVQRGATGWRPGVLPRPLPRRRRARRHCGGLVVGGPQLRRVHPPPARHALQRVRPTRGEPELGARREVTHRGGYQHLAGLGEGDDASRHVDREAGDRLAVDVALPVWRPASTAMPSSGAARTAASAHDSASPVRSKSAKNRSPVVCTSWPLLAVSAERTMPR
jgi:hypothetical protein